MSEIYNKMFPSKTPLMQSVVEKEKKKGYYGPDGVPNVPTAEKRKYPEIQEAFVALSKEKLSDKDYKKKFKEKFVNDSIGGNSKEHYLLD